MVNIVELWVVLINLTGLGSLLSLKLFLQRRDSLLLSHLWPIHHEIEEKPCKEIFLGLSSSKDMYKELQGMVTFPRVDTN